MKNIFLVSYLKNKGVRRICFILGLLFSIFAFFVWKANFKYNFFDLSFNNIEEIQQDYSYNNEVLKAIFIKYPVDFGKKLNIFDNWNEFFINKYSRDYEYRMKFLKECQDSKIAEELLVCKKLNSYVSQKITVNRHNLFYFFELWYVVFVFYLPFLFAIIIRWIYVGFKENESSQVK